MQLDATIIKKLTGCHRKYVLEQVLGARDAFKIRNSDLSFGIAWHQAIEQNGRYDTDTMTFDETTGKNRKNFTDSVFTTLGLLDTIKKAGWAVYHEVKFEIPLETCVLTGFVDLLCVNPQDGVFFIDFKTSKAKSKPYGHMLYDWQTQIYLFAGVQLFPEKFSHLQYYNVQFLKKQHIIEKINFPSMAARSKQYIVEKTNILSEKKQLLDSCTIADMDKFLLRGDAYSCANCAMSVCCYSLDRHDVLPVGWILDPASIWDPQKTHRGPNMKEIITWQN